MNAFPPCKQACEHPDGKERGKRMGCFEDLPENRQLNLGPHLKLKRCPRYYLEKEQPEATPWVNEMLRLWSAYEKGNLSSFCFSPSLKTLESIDIIDEEIQRLKNAAMEEASKSHKKANVTSSRH